jgi:hypothetical protein
MSMAAPRPEFHVLSNGELLFGVSLILCTEEWIQLFTETVLAFNLHFQHIHIGTYIEFNVQGNQVHHSKER